MEPWLVCRITLYAYRRKKAVVAVRTWHPLETGARAHLLLRGADGAVFQVAGAVAKSAAGEGHYRVVVQIPWDTALSLTAWAGKAVEEGASTVLHNYAVQIKGMVLPPFKLVFDGHLTLRGAFIRKVLDAPPGNYFLELILDGASLLVPLKYYKHERRDKRAGGDSGLFNVPIDVLYTLYDWGYYDPGADAVRLRARVWAPAGPLK